MLQLQHQEMTYILHDVNSASTKRNRVRRNYVLYVSITSFGRDDYNFGPNLMKHRKNHVCFSRFMLYALMLYVETL